MLNCQLEIVRDEFVTCIDHHEEFYVNLLFGRSIYRPIYTHMGKLTRIAVKNLGTTADVGMK